MTVILPDASVPLMLGDRMHPDWYRLFRLFADAYNSTSSEASSDIEELQALDVLTTRGDLLTRDATTYVRKAIGASGTILTSDGTDPVWTPPAETGGVETIVATTSFPAQATVEIEDIPATYAYLHLKITGASCDTATRAIVVRASVDNGANFDSTGTNYIGWYAQATPTFANVGTGSLVGGAAVAAAVAQDFSIQISSYQGGMHAIAHSAIQGSGTEYTSMVAYLGSTSAINALRIGWNNTGVFDAGSYTLLGVK